MASLEKAGLGIVGILAAVFVPVFTDYDVAEALSLEDSVVAPVFTDIGDNMDNFSERAQGLETQQANFDRSLEQLGTN